MKLFPLVIATPDGNVFSGEIYKLSVRGTEGELAVMAGHIPFVTTVKEGVIRLDFGDREKKASVSSGILNVSPTETTLLAGYVTFLDES